MEGYNVFINKIVLGVEEKLGDEYEVKTERILKNNSCEYQSLLISKVKEEDCRIAPAIRMDSWYILYKEGLCIGNIVDKVIEIYNKGMEEVKSIKGICESGKNVASHIFFRLINAERNTKILGSSPHILFEDLAITFHYMCSNDGSTLQSFRVTDKIAKEWEVSKDELMEYAMKNAPVLFPEKFISMETMVESMCMNKSWEEYETSNCEDAIPMYVLTNESGVNGAAAILYSKNIEKLAQHYESNLYILPSSIHEVILLPQSECGNVEWLRELVKEVNENHVDLIEQLSDNVYMYDFCEKTIKIC